MSSITVPHSATRPRRAFIQRARGWRNYIYLLPAILFFLVYMAYPIVRAMWMSFTNFQYLSTEPAQFVGLQNYANALKDSIFLLGLRRAATFTAYFLPGVIFIPLFIAILVDRVKNAHVATVYRLILLIPAVIPAAMVFVLWRWLFEFEIGPINVILRDHLGLFNRFNAPQWVGLSPLALPTVAFVEIWWGLGYHTMFFLAGLASIPRELFEAARVDGASEWQMFWHVTLPRLQPIMLILVILRFGSAMAVIDDFIIMGGFNRALPTYTWTVYMWHMAFQLGTWPQGYATAVGWLGAGAMLVVVTIMMYIFRNRD